jgi:hypothetical protein
MRFDVDDKNFDADGICAGGICMGVPVDIDSSCCPVETVNFQPVDRSPQERTGCCRQKHKQSQPVSDAEPELIENCYSAHGILGTAVIAEIRRIIRKFPTTGNSKTALPAGVFRIIPDK